MSKFFKVLVILLSGLFSFPFALRAASAGVALPHTQHWNTYSPWNNPAYGGASLDGSQSAPGSPSTSLKFTFPAGYPNGNAPDILGVELATPVSELWIQYWFKFSSNWTIHNVNDKQLYVKFTSTGALFWVGSKWGDPHLAMEGNDDLQEPYVKMANVSGSPNLYDGAWHKLTFHAVLNTVGVSNGVFQGWVDDVLALNYSNVRYRTKAILMSNVNVAPVWGGDSGWVKPANEYFWVDFIVISEDPIGSVPSISPVPLKVPDAPSALLIN